MNDWTDDIEKILENIRINSISLSNYHKEKYYYYKSYLKFFKLPLIILSSITSIASVGLTGYLEQDKCANFVSKVHGIQVSGSIFISYHRNFRHIHN